MTKVDGGHFIYLTDEQAEILLDWIWDGPGQVADLPIEEAALYDHLWEVLGDDSDLG